MRIGDLKNKNLKSPLQSPAKSETAVAKVDFIQTLDTQQERERERDIQRLLALIEDHGRRLAKSRSLADLKRYKHAVTDFLKEANERTYRLKEESGWDFMGNRKHQMLVQKIDEKMEELTEVVKSEQENNLRVLEIIDEIKGLLVDQYL